MWMLLSAVVVCFTIIVLFRMFIDLRRVEFQHYRSMAGDRRDYERYIEVTTGRKPRAEMPDFSRALTTRSGLSRLGAERIDRLHRMTDAKVNAMLKYKLEREREIRRMSQHVGYDPKPWIDPEMTELMRRG